MKLHIKVALATGGLLVGFLPMAFASALSVSCSGAVSSPNITWAATSTGGAAPVAFLWSNGSTSASQVLSYTPGTYSMNIQATDASSSVATSTCSATIPQNVPSIASFIASPASITAGQSTLLSWGVSNASTTSLDNSIGIVSGTSVTVTPSVTTTYTLSAVNPSGTTTANTTVVVNATSTSISGINAQIQALLNQLAALRTQLFQLISLRGGSTRATSTFPGFGFGLGFGHENENDTDNDNGGHWFASSTATTSMHVRRHATSTRHYNPKNRKYNNGLHAGWDF